MGKTFILLVFVFNNVFVNLSSCLSLLVYSWRSGSALRRGGPRGWRAGLGVLPVHGARAANAQPAAVCWGVIWWRGNACGKTTLPTLGKKNCLQSTVWCDGAAWPGAGFGSPRGPGLAALCPSPRWPGPAGGRSCVRPVRPNPSLGAVFAAAFVTKNSSLWYSEGTVKLNCESIVLLLRSLSEWAQWEIEYLGKGNVYHVWGFVSTAPLCWREDFFFSY